MSLVEKQAAFLETLAGKLRSGEAFLHVGTQIHGDGTQAQSLVAVNLSGEELRIECGHSELPEKAEYALARLAGPDYAAAFAEGVIRRRDWDRYEMLMVKCEERAEEYGKLSTVVKGMRKAWDAVRVVDGECWYSEEVASAAVEIISTIKW